MLQAGRSKCLLTFSLVLAVALVSTVANAQITTTGIHGIVTDSSGAVIPKASLKLVDTATGLEKQTVSGEDGSFVFANLQAGTYTLSASAAGFQNAVCSKVLVDAGRITDQPVDMKVGSTTETVEVSASTVALATTTNEVGTTISNNSVMNVPLAGRETLNFALLMPGVGNTQGNDRYSTFNGLPNASMDITVDGMNNNSQRWKSGGTSFYEFAPSRIDAIEQVTVSTTGLGSDAGGQGAMQIRMTTKRGSDQYHFKVLEQLTNEDLNANSYFNTLQHIARPKRRQNNEVGLISGPLVPFVPYLRHKLFFFAYFEAQPQPGSQTNTTNLLTDASLGGNFTYNGTDGTQRTVNLLAAAGAAGYTSTLDPTVAGIFAKINASKVNAIGYQPIAGAPFATAMQWNFSTFTNQQYPTARLNYQITPGLGWHGTWNLRHSAFGSGGPPYPGSGYDWNNASTVTTYVASNQFDWTISPHLLNNLTFGIQSNLEAFNPGGNTHQWAPQGDRIINLPLVSNYIPGNVPEVRNNPVFDLVNNLTWVRGQHTFTLGGSFRHTPYYDRYDSRPLAYSFGVASSDTVSSALLAALPAINQSNVGFSNQSDFNNALSLYAGLTGRLTSISGTYAVDEKTHRYVPFAPLVYRYNFNTGGIFFQDAYRIRPTLTLNFGLRNQFDGPISISNGVDGYPTADSFFGPSTRLFHPGELNGNLNPAYGPVQNPYSSDLLNPAPNFGFAWNPSGDSGWRGKILGDHKTVIRSSYAINFYNEGLNAISFMLEGNKGSTQTLNASAGSVGFPVGQINLSSPQQPTLSVAPASFSFPMSMTPYVLNGGQSLNYANPHLRSPYVQNWVLGVQRGLPGNVVLQVNYVGNKATHVWHYQNISETNIFENGFLTEFQNAQNNLAIANGISVSQLATATLTTRNFSNAGKPGQVPLPIFETAFGANGSAGPLATGSGFGSSGFITNLQQGAAASLAGTLASTSTPTYYCRLVGANFGPCAAQGYTAKTPYAMNFFQPNPYANNLRYQNDDANTDYNALQVEGRKGLSHGLFFDVAYTWSHGLGTEQNATDTQGTYTWYTMRNGHLNYGPIPFDHRHTFTSFWTYDLPIGKSKALDLRYTVLNRVLGGWTLGGIEKIISGAPSIMGGGRATVNNLSTAGVDFGNGLTPQALKDRLSSPTSSYDASCTCFHTRVSDMVQVNGAPSPAFYAPGSTAGKYSVITYLYGKATFQLDMNLNKDFSITERLRMGINFQAFNVLNHPFLNLGNTGVTSTTFGNITGATGARTAQIRAYVSW